MVSKNYNFIKALEVYEITNQLEYSSIYINRILVYKLDCRFKNELIYLN